VLARLTWANLKAAIKSYYDAVTSTLTNKTISGTDNTITNIAQTSVTGLSTALSGKEPTINPGTTSQYYRGDKAWATLDKSAVGLGNVDNTADASKTVAAATNLVASTTTAVQLGTIELGHASDTTLSRSSAGVLAVEGVVVDTVSATNTLTNKTLTNPTINNYTEGVVAIGTVTSSSTLSLTNGTVQTATLTASTACTFTMPTATAGKSFTLLLKQAASTGNGSATFTGVKWGTAGAPTVTAAAGKMDIFTFFADGTNWYGSIAQGYTP